MERLNELIRCIINDYRKRKLNEINKVNKKQLYECNNS